MAKVRRRSGVLLLWIFCYDARVPIHQPQNLSLQFWHFMMDLHNYFKLENLFTTPDRNRPLLGYSNLCLRVWAQHLSLGFTSSCQSRVYYKPRIFDSFSTDEALNNP